MHEEYSRQFTKDAKLIMASKSVSGTNGTWERAASNKGLIVRSNIFMTCRDPRTTEGHVGKSQ